MPTIEVPGLGPIQFPDSMSGDQIVQAIERDILPQARAPRQVSEEPMGPPQPAPAPTAESVDRSALERNVLDPLERGYQNLMIGIGAFRSRSPESFYGLTPEDAAADIVRRQRRLSQIPRTEASQQAFAEAERTGSVAGAVGRLGTSSSALGDIAAESFGSNPLAAPVGLLANVTPVPVLRQIIGALGGALGFPTEFATSMGDALLKTAQERGINTNDPQQVAELIRAINADPELKDKMKSDALTRASIISAIDAAAGYGAGRLVTRGAAGRIGGGAAIEGAGGGVGEAAAQLATEGKIDPVEVAAEILGGGAMGAAGNIRRSPEPPARGENEELRRALEDIVAGRPEEPPAPLALPRERATYDFPGGVLTRTQAENYLETLEQRFPELRFVGGGTEEARGDFDTRLRYAQVKLQDEQEKVQEGFQQQQEDLIRREVAFSPETQAAFDIAQARAGRAGSTITDLRAGAPEVAPPRMVLDPKFDKNNRLIGGEAVINVTGVTPEGTVFATVNREVNGVVREVPLEVNPDNIYSFPMRETARSTQESIAARVGPEQVAGKRGAGVDPLGRSLTPRRVTDRTSNLPETQRETRPDWRLGEQVGAAPEAQEQAPQLPPDIKALIDDIRKGRAAPKKQVSLVQQIIKGGGLRDTGGEILQFLGGSVKNRPGLINKNKRTVVMKGGKPTWKGGLQLDQAAEYLAGEGYFIDIPTDNELLEAINDELSGRAVNYGPTEDVKGQELAAAANQLERELDAAGVSINDSDEDIARALGFERQESPRTLEDIEREDEARRISYSARRTQPEEAATTPEAAPEEEVPNQEKAQEIVNKFLEDLRGKGRAGRLLANELSNLLKNNKLNANQLYEAFMVSETLLNSMPAGANYRFRFLEDIVIDNEEAAKRSGAKVGDQAQGRVIRPTDSLPGFVEISLAENMLPMLRETAAHESFHVLKDYFGVYDKSFDGQINKHFKQDMTLNDMEPSIKRVLKSTKLPNSNQSYWDSLVDGIGLDTKLDLEEAQAYAFGSLTDAAIRGKPMSGLLAPFKRFVNFTKDFFSKLRSGFRGDGFQTPADLLAGAAKRAPGLTQEAPTEGGGRYSARRVEKDSVLEEAARGVREGTVTREEYERLVNERKPITPYEAVPEPATEAQIRNALQKTDPRKVEKIGVPSETLKRGDMVGLRLDIPAYSKQNTWVVSVHEARPGTNFYAGTAIGYEPTAIATNVDMGVVPKAAMDIAAGDKDKSTIAVMRGKWEPATPKEAKARADEAINNPDWVQVGMDPRRHQYFYDRTTKEPVVAADEVIQIGPLVLAKNPTYGEKSDYRFSARRAPDQRFASRQAAAQKTFQQQVISEADKIGLLDKVLSVLIDKKKGESPGAAIARTSINRAAGLYNADELASANGYTGRSAGRAMELALSNSGRIAQMLSHGMGRIDPVTGIISRRSDVKPLIQIMRDAGIKDKATKEGLQVYLAALKERDLRKNGRKGFLNATDKDVLDSIKDAEAKNPKWKQAAADIDKFNNALIDWAVDTGITSKAEGQKLRDVFYTPFYRVMETDSISEPGRSVTPRIGESFTNVASAINRELKGGERPLADLFSNMILNSDSIMKAGLKNLAMKTSAEVMEFAKLGKKNTTDTKNENTITYKVNGKDVAFDVEDAALFSALAGMPRTMQSGIYNTMAKMASVFRDFVTVAPSFIFSNLYKGKISAYVQEGQPFYTNTLAGVRDFLNASETAQNFQLQTGFGGMEYGMGPRDMAKVFERKLTDQGIMKSLSKGNVWSAIRQSYSKMQEISEASEMAERIKLSENLIAKGMKPEDAYFQAYLLAPYSRRGTGEGWLGSSVQFMMPLVPFLNAKIQTTYRLVENEKGDKRRLWTLGIPQQIFLRGLVLTAFSLMAYGLALEDDEEKWDKIPPYMKLNYDIIPFMGNYITLPRAFEIGQVFGALPVFILDAIRRGEGKDLAEALVEVGKNTFWMNPIPKAVDPILGAFTNYDFFRGRPLETKGEQALPVGERINRSTTKTGEALSAVVNSVFGNILSPIKAQALLDGYTGTLGASLMAGFDSILAAGGMIPGKPAGAFGDPSSMPGIIANFAGMQRFYREDEQMVSRFVGDFYKIKEMTDQLVRSQNLARQARDFERLTELQGEAGLPLRLRTSVNAASEQIADLNKRIRMIERSDRDAVDKSTAIEPLIRRRDQVAKRVVDQARNIGAF